MIGNILVVNLASVRHPPKRMNWLFNDIWHNIIMTQKLMIYCSPNWLITCYHRQVQISHSTMLFEFLMILQHIIVILCECNSKSFKDRQVDHTLLSFDARWWLVPIQATRDREMPQVVYWNHHRFANVFDDFPLKCPLKGIQISSLIYLGSYVWIDT